MILNFDKKQGFDSTELMIDDAAYTLAFLQCFDSSVKFHCQFKGCLLPPVSVPDCSKGFPNKSSIMHMYYHMDR